jgi:hypothetical protein
MTCRLTCVSSGHGPRRCAAVRYDIKWAAPLKRRAVGRLFEVLWLSSSLRRASTRLEITPSAWSYAADNLVKSRA